MQKQVESLNLTTLPLEYISRSPFSVMLICTQSKSHFIQQKLQLYNSRFRHLFNILISFVHCTVTLVNFRFCKPFCATASNVNVWDFNMIESRYFPTMFRLSQGKPVSYSQLPLITMTVDSFLQG